MRNYGFANSIEDSRPCTTLVVTKPIKGIRVHLDLGVTPKKILDVTDYLGKSKHAGENIRLLPAADVGLIWTEQGKQVSNDKWLDNTFVFVSDEEVKPMGWICANCGKILGEGDTVLFTQGRQYCSEGCRKQFYQNEIVEKIRTRLSDGIDKFLEESELTFEEVMESYNVGCIPDDEQSESFILEGMLGKILVNCFMKVEFTQADWEAQTGVLCKFVFDYKAEFYNPFFERSVENATTIEFARYDGIDTTMTKVDFIQFLTELEFTALAIKRSLQQLPL